MNNIKAFRDFINNKYSNGKLVCEHENIYVIVKDYNVDDNQYEMKFNQ